MTILSYTLILPTVYHRFKHRTLQIRSHIEYFSTNLQYSCALFILKIDLKTFSHTNDFYDLMTFDSVLLFGATLYMHLLALAATNN